MRNRFALPVTHYALPTQCMSEIVLDIETQNTFLEVGQGNTAGLKVSLVCLYDYGNDSFKAYRENELASLWPVLEHAERIIGYNSRYFDLPVLNNYYSGDINKLPQLDLLEEVKKNLGFRLKLDDLAQATLKTAKGGNGLQAVEWFKQGDWEKLIKYCQEDVRITRDIYEYGKKHRQLFYTDLARQELRPFPVNFSPPVKAAAPSGQNINLTLPF